MLKSAHHERVLVVEGALVFAEEACFSATHWARAAKFGLAAGFVVTQRMWVETMTKSKLPDLNEATWGGRHQLKSGLLGALVAAVGKRSQPCR